MLSYAYLWMKSNFNHHYHGLRYYIMKNQKMYPLDFLRYRQPCVKMQIELVENWMKFAQIFINNLSKVNFIHYFFWLQMERDFRINYFDVFESKMNMTTNIIRQNEELMEMSKIENLNIENISVPRKMSDSFENFFDDHKYAIKTDNELIQNNVKKLGTDEIFNKLIEKFVVKNKPGKSKLEKLKIDEVFKAFFFNREKNKNSKFDLQTRSDVDSTQKHFEDANKNQSFKQKSNFENQNSQSQIPEPKISCDESISFTDNKEISNRDPNLNKLSFELQNYFFKCPEPDNKLQHPFSSLYVRKPSFNNRQTFFNLSNHNSENEKKQKTFDFETFVSQFVESPIESNQKMFTKVKASHPVLDMFHKKNSKKNEKKNSLNFDGIKYPSQQSFVEEPSSKTIPVVKPIGKNLKKKKTLLDSHLITDEIVEIFLSNRKKHTENLNVDKEKSVSQNHTKQEKSTSVETKYSFNVQNILSSNDQEQNFKNNNNDEKCFDFEKFVSQFTESSAQSDNSEEKLTPKSSFATKSAETLFNPLNDQEKNLDNSKHDTDKKSFNFENFALQFSESSQSIDHSHGTSTPIYRKPSYEKSSSENLVKNLKNDLYFVINDQFDENSQF